MFEFLRRNLIESTDLIFCFLIVYDISISSNTIDKENKNYKYMNATASSSRIINMACFSFRICTILPLFILKDNSSEVHYYFTRPMFSFAYNGRKSKIGWIKTFVMQIWLWRIHEKKIYHIFCNHYIRAWNNRRICSIHKLLQDHQYFAQCQESTDHE